MRVKGGEGNARKVEDKRRKERGREGQKEVMGRERSSGA